MTSQNFLPIDFIHRKLRDFIFSHSEEHLHFNNIPNSDLYLKLLKDSVIHISEHFNDAFPKNYRRRSDKFLLQVDEISEIDIRINNDYVIILTLGLIIAVEDATQSIYSDKHVPLANSLGETPEMRSVIQLPHHSYSDTVRYFDYTDLINILRQVEKSGWDFVPFLFRLLSQSSHRRMLGDLSSNISIEWLFSHEDAHVYLGHVAYSKSNYNKGDYFNEFYKNGNTPNLHNIYCEYDADRNATWRLVDNYVDGNVFDSYYFLSETIEFLEYHTNYKLSPNTIRISILSNLILTSISIDLIIFQRCIMKYSGDSENYPKIMFRFLNIIMETIHRIFTQIFNTNNSELILEFIKESIPVIFYFFKEQISIIRYYLIDGSPVNYDYESSLYKKDFIELKPFFKDDFYTSLSLYCIVVFGNTFKDEDNKYTLSIIPIEYRNIFSEFTSEWIAYIEYANTLLEYRLAENQNLSDKIVENIKNNKSMIEMLQNNVK